jgi:transposase-like protein
MPKTIPCPHCGFGRSWAIRRAHRRCKKCRREWSPGDRFPVRGSRLTTKDWRRLIEAFLSGRTVRTLARQGCVAYATAQRAARLMREAMAQDVPELFVGAVEIDERYVGGAWKNKAIHVRRAYSPGKGRGTLKQPIFGILHRETGQVRIWLVPDTREDTLFPIIFQRVVRGSRILTDGCQVYRSLPSRGYLHAWVDHEAGEYVRGDVHTQGLDGFWGYLKTRLHSVGGVRKRFAHLFVREIQWRYNQRKLSDEEKAERLLGLVTTFGGRF